MRWKWVCLGVVVLVAAAMAAVYAVLASYDYNKLKPRMARMVKEATGRELKLEGEVDLTIGFTPTLVVRKAGFANAPWGSQPQMIQVDTLEAAVRLLPLLAGEVVVTYVGLSGVDVLLETDANGKGNWDFSADRGSGKRTGKFQSLGIAVDQIRIEDLHLAYRGRRTENEAHYTIDRLDVARQEAADRLAIDLQARYNAIPVALSGQTGGLQALRAHQRFPLELSGTFAGAKVETAGAIDDLLTLRGIALKTHVSGSDLAALGIDKTILLPQTSAFDATGLLRGSKASLALEDLTGTLSGRGLALAFSGSVGNLFALSAIDLELKGDGKDLSTIGAMIGQKLPATETFDFRGRLQGSPQHLSFLKAQASAKRGGLHVGFTGRVGDVQNFRDLDLQVSGSGKDLGEITPLIGIRLPATDDFTLEGRLRGSPQGLSFEEAKANARRGDLHVVFEGEIGDLLDFSGLGLQVRAAGRDLAEVGPMIGVTLPATDDFSVKGRLEGSAKALGLKAAQGRAKRGRMNLALDGRIRNVLTLEGVDLNVQGRGRNLEDVGKMIAMALPATDAFEVRGRLTGSAKSLSFRHVRASAQRGGLKLGLSGGIDGLFTDKTLNLDVHASGTELAEIGPLVGAALPALGPFDISANLAGSPKAISLSDVSAIVDKSDFKGQVEMAFRKRPKISVHLDSSVIDFSRLMNPIDKNAKKLAVDPSPQRHWLPDDPLPFDVLKKVDADIRIRARDIHARDARLEFGHLVLNLENGDFSIDKLEAAYQKAKISGHLAIRDESPPRIALDFLVQGFNLGDFLKETGKSDKVQAVVDIAAHGESRGTSLTWSGGPFERLHWCGHGERLPVPLSRDPLRESQPEGPFPLGLGPAPSGKGRPDQLCGGPIRYPGRGGHQPGLCVRQPACRPDRRRRAQPGHRTN